MKRTLTRFLVAWMFALAIVRVAGELGLRLNTTASVPRGFYWLSSKQPAIGTYVAVCPPPSPVFVQASNLGYLISGRCPSGYAELIKVLAAGPGDSVRTDSDGVRINGRLWPSSAPLPVHIAGWGLPQVAGLDVTLGENAVLVMSKDCAFGFDGRYFGLLPRSVITATAVPLLTW